MGSNKPKQERQRKISEDWGKGEAKQRGYKLNQPEKHYEKEWRERQDTDRSVNRPENQDREPASAPIWRN